MMLAVSWDSWLATYMQSLHLAWASLQHGSCVSKVSMSRGRELHKIHIAFYNLALEVTLCRFPWTENELSLSGKRRAIIFPSWKLGGKVLEEHKGPEILQWALWKIKSATFIVWEAAVFYITLVKFEKW